MINHEVSLVWWKIHLNQKLPLHMTYVMEGTSHDEVDLITLIWMSTITYTFLVQSSAYLALNFTISIMYFLMCSLIISYICHSIVGECPNSREHNIQLSFANIIRWLLLRKTYVKPNINIDTSASIVWGKETEPKRLTPTQSKGHGRHNPNVSPSSLV